MRAAPLFSFFFSRRSNSGTRYGSREPFWTPSVRRMSEILNHAIFSCPDSTFVSLRRSCKPWLLQNGGENSDKVQCMGRWACCVCVWVLSFGLCNLTSSPWLTCPVSTRSQTERTYSTLRDIDQESRRYTLSPPPRSQRLHSKQAFEMAGKNYEEQQRKVNAVSYPQEEHSDSAIQICKSTAVSRHDEGTPLANDLTWHSYSEGCVSAGARRLLLLRTSCVFCM